MAQLLARSVQPVAAAAPLPGNGSSPAGAQAAAEPGAPLGDGPPPAPPAAG